MGRTDLLCPICGAPSALVDVVDLNKNCSNQDGIVFELSGVPIYYALCGQCKFCWSPDMYEWSLDEFLVYIYNDDYIKFDPDYSGKRPINNAKIINSLFDKRTHQIRHLDYGGGDGMLSQLLRKDGWDSASYDPFVDKGVDVKALGKFDLITAFEVFEHVPDVDSLMSDIKSLLSADGMVLFSTLLSDGHIAKNSKLTWWYASPRNGHISLFSRNSIAVLAQKNGLNWGSFSEGFHALFYSPPSWASHIFKSS